MRLLGWDFKTVMGCFSLFVCVNFIQYPSRWEHLLRSSFNVLDKVSMSYGIRH